METLDLDYGKCGCQPFLGGQITIGEDEVEIEIEIEIDQEAGNPRKEWDQVSTMLGYNRDIYIGDDETIRSHEGLMDALEQVACDLDPTLADRLYFWENDRGWAQLYNANKCDVWKAIDASNAKQRELIERALEDNCAAIMELHVRGHGPQNGIWASGWDGLDDYADGYAFVTKDKAREELRLQRVSEKARKWAERAIKAETEEYNLYLEGSIYWFRVFIDGAIADSCGGLYGLDQTIAVINDEVLAEHGVKVESPF